MFIISVSHRFTKGKDYWPKYNGVKPIVKNELDAIYLLYGNEDMDKFIPKAEQIKIDFSVYNKDTEFRVWYDRLYSYNEFLDCDLILYYMSDSEDLRNDLILFGIQTRIERNSDLSANLSEAKIYKPFKNESIVYVEDIYVTVL
jgi:hypothetical protein